jgi:uncharacterized membrane protein (DUF4010 family)
MDSLPFRLALALAIGLLIGLERGWRTRTIEDHQRAAGFRTFALIGFLGGLAGALTPLSGEVVLAAAVLGFIGVFGAFEWLQARSVRNLSATTMIAGIATFLLGAYAVLGEQPVAVGGAVAVTLMLALRQPLHRWVAALKWEELRAALVLLAMTFLLLPILPNRNIDPWDTINPAEIWLLAIMIAAISFGGYVLVRLFGERLGIIMAAMAGGLTSSTATTLTLARMGRDNGDAPHLLAGGILLSGVVMFARVGIVAGLLNPSLLPALAKQEQRGHCQHRPTRSDQGRGQRASVHPRLVLSSPLDLRIALRFALLIAVLMLASGLLHRWAGAAGVLGLAAVSGLVDVDAVTLSMARMGGEQIALATAASAIAVTVAVNTLTKAVMAGWVGGRAIGLRVAMASLAAVTAGALAAAIA